mmetsp:Transcript_88517/g.286650  ORF Transcript_88517/g.286650 Transcript_88517/m.286650 type:complete len:193 (-) Transcript_88517:333-911(-)
MFVMFVVLAAPSSMSAAVSFADRLEASAGAVEVSVGAAVEEVAEAMVEVAEVVEVADVAVTVVVDELVTELVEGVAVVEVVVVDVVVVMVLVEGVAVVVPVVLVMVTVEDSWQVTEGKPLQCGTSPLPQKGYALQLAHPGSVAGQGESPPWARATVPTPAALARTARTMLRVRPSRTAMVSFTGGRASTPSK